MKLENEFLYAEISEMGAEVIRIYDKENQRDILWEGDPKYWKRHSPVLFPNVGKKPIEIPYGSEGSSIRQVSMDLQEIRCLHASNHPRTMLRL